MYLLQITNKYLIRYLTKIVTAEILENCLQIICVKNIYVLSLSIGRKLIEIVFLGDYIIQIKESCV